MHMMISADINLLKWLEINITNNIEFSTADLHSNTNKACVESVDFRVHIMLFARVQMNM